MGVNKTVMIAGTFDLLHPSHISILNNAKELGDELIVMLSTDEFNSDKGKTSIMSYEERYFMLTNLRCVNKVVSEQSWDDKLKYISEYDVDVFVMGSDWEGKFDDLPCEVKYFQRGDISTTEIKERVINDYMSGKKI